MSVDAFLSKLPPAFAKQVTMAREVETHRLPLYSKGLTKDLGGGIARGRVCLIHGDPSAGKSALVLQSIAQWQKDDLVCAFIDVEGTFDKTWAESLGVDTSKLIVQRTAKSSGKVERDTIPLIQADIDVIVIDSISDIAPEAFVNDEGELKDQDGRKQIGAHAKAITALISAIHYYNENTAIILISQDTTNFGQTYVEMVPHGGKKTQFNSSQIIRLKSSKADSNFIKGQVMVAGNPVEKLVGRKVQYIITKNKLGPVKGTGEWHFYYDGGFVGIDAAQELLSMAMRYGIVNKKGAWFYYGEEKYQGEKNLISSLRHDDDLRAAVSADIDLAETKTLGEEDSDDEN